MNIPGLTRPNNGYTSPALGMGIGVNTDMGSPDAVAQGTLGAPAGMAQAPDLNSLANARTLPAAEMMVRQALGLGTTDYDTIMGAVPQQFQSMIRAKVPRRIGQ